MIYLGGFIVSILMYGSFDYKEVNRMKVKLDTFTYTWDMAALELLNSEFKMMDLLRAQKITNEDGSSIIDDIVFYGGLEVERPDTSTVIDYFKAPWSE